jgi:hypothetical protein
MSALHWEAEAQMEDKLPVGLRKDLRVDTLPLSLAAQREMLEEAPQEI